MSCGSDSKVIKRALNKTVKFEDDPIFFHREYNRYIWNTKTDLSMSDFVNDMELRLGLVDPFSSLNIMPLSTNGNSSKIYGGATN